MEHHSSYLDNNLIKDYYKNGEYKLIWAWTKDTLKRHKHFEPYVYLYKAILKYPQAKINETNTIAALYFTFMILSAEFINQD